MFKGTPSGSDTRITKFMYYSKALQSILFSFVCVDALRPSQQFLSHIVTVCCCVPGFS